jgi:replicative DNA helicase
MNLLATFEEGKLGKNQGVSTGISNLDKAIDGIQRRAIYTIAADAKVGKTTFVDQAFLLEPFITSLNNIELNKNLKWIYFSFEISRIKKEFKLACYFFAKIYKIGSFVHKGKKYDLIFFIY